MDILNKLPLFFGLATIFVVNGCGNSPESSTVKVAEESQNSLEPLIKVESVSDWVVLFDFKTKQVWMHGPDLTKKQYPKNGKL